MTKHFSFRGVMKTVRKGLGKVGKNGNLEVLQMVEIAVN